MASSAFMKALSKKKNAASAMKSLNEATQTEFKVPEVPDGSYIFHVKAEVGVTPNKGIPFVSLKWQIVDDSEHKGAKHNMTYYLEDEDEDRLDMTFAALGRSFKAILDTDELSVEDAGDIEALVDAVNDEDAYVRGRIKNWKGAKSNGINVYFNQRVQVESDDTDTDND